MAPGARQEFTWRIGPTEGGPIQEIGVEVTCDARADGRVFIDYLTWDGCPDVTLSPLVQGAKTWLASWVNAASNFEGGAGFDVIQNAGRGLVMQGHETWIDYQVSATVTPHMGAAAGLAARVGGLRRYYALLLCHDGMLQLVKARDSVSVLAQAPQAWQAGKKYPLTLRVSGRHLTALVDGKVLLEVDDRDQPLERGGMALVVDEGRAFFGPVAIGPLPVSGSTHA